MSTGEGGRKLILIFVGLFCIKGTMYLRQYITNNFNGNARGTYHFVNHQTRPAPGRTVNFGYHASKTGKNIVKVQAIDIRKETGFDKAQRILQNNVILNLVL